MKESVWPEWCVSGLFDVFVDHLLKSFDCAAYLCQAALVQKGGGEGIGDGR